MHQRETQNKDNRTTFVEPWILSEFCYVKIVSEFLKEMYHALSNQKPFKSGGNMQDFSINKKTLKILPGILNEKRNGTNNITLTDYINSDSNV